MYLYACMVIEKILNTKVTNVAFSHGGIIIANDTDITLGTQLSFILKLKLS